MRSLYIVAAGLSVAGCLTVMPPQGDAPQKPAATATSKTATPVPTESATPTAQTGGSIEAAIDGRVAPSPIVAILGGSAR